MIEYELWVDESGEFAKDRQLVRRNLRPSLIGGILFKKGKFSLNKAEQILKCEYYHSNESSVEDTFIRFQKIAEQDITLVEISNDECISIIDSNLTYQNIMAEGMIQIIKRLKVLNRDEIHIKILIAERGDCTSEDKNDRKVSVEQYERRITERMLLEGYRNDISNKYWDIEVANARKDARLMIADIVCNSFLTRDTKFKGEMGDFINQTHDDEVKTWRFTVFENSVSKQVSNYLFERRLGEAVLYLCQSDNSEFIQNKMKEISSYLEGVSTIEIKLQTDIISSTISYYINVSRDYDKCLNLLNNLLCYWIPELEMYFGTQDTEPLNEIRKDYLFYKDTIYTHMGDVERSYKCEKECDLLIEHMPLSWDNIAYRMKYMNRKIITRMNTFDFANAVQECDGLVERCRAVKEALDLVNDHEEVGCFEELAKALGTRAQLYMFQIRFGKDMYAHAVEDSESAIKEFRNENDKRRQYSYRVQIETEKGNFDEALRFLYLQNGLEIQKHQIKDVVENLGKDIFGLCSYVRLMAEGAAAGWECSEAMYEALNVQNYVKELRENEKQYHPKEIVLWKYAFYQIQCNREKAAFENYKAAISCCFCTDNITVNMIGIAILLERYAYAIKLSSKEKKPYLRELIKYYESVYSREIPEPMKSLFEQIDMDKEDWKYYYDLSRRVTY